MWQNYKWDKILYKLSIRNISASTSTLLGLIGTKKKAEKFIKSDRIRLCELNYLLYPILKFKHDCILQF